MYSRWVKAGVSLAVIIGLVSVIAWMFGTSRSEISANVAGNVVVPVTDDIITDYDDPRVSAGSQDTNIDMNDLRNRKLPKRWQRKLWSDSCYKIKGNNTLERCKSVDSDDLGPLYGYILDRG